MRRLVLLALFTAASTALGQAADIYGFDPRAVALGGTQGAADGDFTAVYYNPALLLGADRPSVGVGFTWMRPETYATVTEEFPGNVPLVFRAPPDYAAVTLGANLPFGGKLARRAALGMGLHVPWRHVYRGRLIDDAEASFYRHDSQPDRMQIFAAVAARPVEHLTLGAGVQLMSDFGGQARFEARVGVGGGVGGLIVRRELTNEVSGVVAPTAGASWRVHQRVRLHASWRWELKATYELPIDVTLTESDGTTLDTLRVSTTGVSYYTPHALSAGVAVGVSDALRVTADFAYELWSRAPPTQVTIDIRVGNILRTFLSDCITSRVGPNGRPDCDAGVEPPPRFADIPIGRAGVEYRLDDRATVRAGYFFRPSPVPPQRGKTNVIDPPVHGLSLGGGYSFDDPLEMGRRIVLDAAAQVAVLTPADVVKTRPGPGSGLPDYRVGGWTLDLALAARYEF